MLIGLRIEVGASYTFTYIHTVRVRVRVRGKGRGRAYIRTYWMDRIRVFTAMFSIACSLTLACVICGATLCCAILQPNSYHFNP